MSFNKKYRKFGRAFSVGDCANQISVQNNLSVTPSQMAQMVDAGVPISSALLSGVYDDGINNPSWDLPIDQKRGVDVASVWSAQRDARNNISNGVSPISE